MCKATTQLHLTERKAHQPDVTPDQLLNTLKDLLMVFLFALSANMYASALVARIR